MGGNALIASFARSAARAGVVPAGPVKRADQPPNLQNALPTKNT